MRVIQTLLVLTIVISPCAVYASDKTLSDSDAAQATVAPRKHRFFSDMLMAGKQVGHGFVQQFTRFSSWFLISGTAVVTLSLSTREVGVQQSIQDTQILGPVGQKIGDVAGLVMNFGLAPISAYTIGRVLNKDRAVHFAIELAATQSLALVEVFCVSQIPFHKRPIIERGDIKEEEGSFFNQTLRGRSSYPSGHMVGVSSLMYKGWEWYGWKVGVPATLATILVGWARIEEGQHYLTDIFGTLAITGIAAFAVSRTRYLWSRIAQSKGKDQTSLMIAYPVVNQTSAQLVFAGQF